MVEDFIVYDREDRCIKKVYALDFSQWWISTGYLPGEGERNSFRNEPTDRHMLMRTTGGVDVDGKMIYEGFILEYMLPKGTARHSGEVYWRQEEFAFYVKTNSFSVSLAEILSFKDVRIIGHKYEGHDFPHRVWPAEEDIPTANGGGVNDEQTRT